MSHKEKTKLLKLVLKSSQLVDNAYEQYSKYKTVDKYFYVPVWVRCSESKLMMEVGDKSYSTEEELKGCIEAWSENKLADIKPFINILWENRDVDEIRILLLFDTEEYSFGTTIAFPTTRPLKFDVKKIKFM